MKISAYIPVFNGQFTLAPTLESIKSQTRVPDEIIVVDDGSTDQTAKIAETLSARVVGLGKNMGRGAARYRAMSESQHELVVCCDTGKVLNPRFIEKSISWFKDEKVAAVFGRLTQQNSKTMAARWRGRHLFKLHEPKEVKRKALLATYGAVVRKSCAEKAGGYSPVLRYLEDRDLGQRLLQSGFDVICDPALEICCIEDNTLLQVLERYWRWNANPEETITIRSYVKNVMYSLKVMAAQDLLEKDMQSAVVSLICPHYLFYKNILEKIKRNANKA